MFLHVMNNILKTSQSRTNLSLLLCYQLVKCKLTNCTSLFCMKPALAFSLTASSNTNTGQLWYDDNTMNWSGNPNKKHSALSVACCYRLLGDPYWCTDVSHRLVVLEQLQQVDECGCSPLSLSVFLAFCLLKAMQRRYTKAPPRGRTVRLSAEWLADCW